MLLLTLRKVRFSFRSCMCMIEYVKYVNIRYVIAMIFHFYSVDYCSMPSSIIYKNYTQMRRGMGQHLQTSTDKVWTVGQGRKYQKRKLLIGYVKVKFNIIFTRKVATILTKPVTSLHLFRLIQASVINIIHIINQSRKCTSFTETQ